MAWWVNLKSTKEDIKNQNQNKFFMVKLLCILYKMYTKLCLKIIYVEFLKKQAVHCPYFNVKSSEQDRIEKIDYLEERSELKFNYYK